MYSKLEKKIDPKVSDVFDSTILHTKKRKSTENVNILMMLFSITREHVVQKKITLHVSANYVF